MAGPWAWSTGNTTAPPTTTPKPTDTPAGPAVPLKVEKVPEPPKDPLEQYPLFETTSEGWKGTWDSARAMQMLLNNYRKETGKNARVSSGMRSYDEQAALYKEKGPGWAAPPGHSNHEKGIAYDIHADDLDHFAKYAERYGFARPLATSAHPEPWHFTYQPEASGGERIWGDGDPRLGDAKSRKFQRGTYQNLAASMARSRGLSNEDTAITLRMLQQESGFDPKAKSPAGAYGIPQFKPDTLAPILARKGLKGEDYANSGSVQLDAYYEHIPEVLSQNGGNWARTLAAYNSGQGGLQQQIKTGRMYGETRDYVARILGTTPEQAERWVLTGTGPTAKPINTSAQQQIARNNLYQQSNQLVKLWMEVTDPLQTGQPSSGLVGAPLDIVHSLYWLTAAGRMVNSGLQQKADEVASSRQYVLSKDMWERFFKPLARGVTMGLLPIMDWLGNWDPTNSDAKTRALFASPLGATLLGPAKVAHPFVHSMAEAIKPDEKWLAPEQAALNQARGNQDFTQWAFGLRPGGKSKLDVNAAVANLASMGGELPSLAGTTIAFELMGPKAIGESVVGVVGKMAGSAADRISQWAVLHGWPAGGIDSVASWLGMHAPNLVSKLGPQFLHELGATMTSFGLQSAVQGFGDALQAGKTGRDAAREGILHGFWGASMGGAFHLGSPVVSGLFRALKGGDLVEANSAAQQAGNAATPLLKELNQAIGDPANPLRQGAEAHVMSWVDHLDKMFGGQFTKMAEQRLTKLRNQAQERYASQLQNRIGKVTQDFGARVDAATEAFPQWIMRKGAEAQQIAMDVQTFTKAKADWESANAVLLSEDKIKAGIALMNQEIATQKAMLEAGTPVLGGRLTPATRKGIKELKLTPQDVGLIQQYSTINVGLQKAQERLAGVQDILSPLNQQAVATDLETWKAIGSANEAIGNYLAGAQKDLQMNAPQSWSAMNNLADGAQRRVVIDQMASMYGESIKTLLSKVGLANAVPKRIYDSLLTTTRTITSMLPSNPVSNLERAAASVAEEMKAAQEVLKLQPLPEPKATKVYADNPATKMAFEKQLADTQAYNKDLLTRQLEAQTRLKDLDGEYRALTAVTKAMKDTKSVQVQGRLLRLQSDDAYREVFQQTLKDNGLTEKSFSRVYKNLMTEDPRKALPADAAWERWKRDFGNRRDVKRIKDLKKSNPDVRDFYTKLRKDAWATVPEGTEDKEARLIVARYIRANQLEAPDSPLVPQAIRDEIRLGRENNDPFITTQVPLDWVSSPNQSGNVDPLVRSLQYNPPYQSGQAPVNRTVLTGAGPDGQLKLLDGTARYQVLKAGGKSVINVSARKSVLDSVLRSRMGDDIHSAVTGGAGGPLKSVRSYLTGEAENWWLGLTPDQAAAAIRKELDAVAYESQVRAAPSTVSVQQVQGNEPVSPWTHALGSSFQMSLEMMSSLRDSMEEWLQQKKPLSIRDSLARTYSVFENYWVMHHHQQTIADNIAAEVSDKMAKGIREGTINLGEGPRVKSSYEKDRTLPAVFRDDLARALDSLQTDGEAMKQFLEKQPGMREVLGATFDLMRILEEYKVSNPELQDMFRQAYWPMRFPELATLQAGRRGQALSGSFLASEQKRQIQTFDQAQEIHTQATTDLMKGLWSNDPKVDPQTLEGRIQKFRSMAPDKQAQMFPNMTAKQISKMNMGLALRNPVMDPAQIIRGQLSAVLRADLVRDTVKRLANIPLPGSTTMMVVRLKFEGSPRQSPGEVGGPGQPSAPAQKVAAAPPVVKLMTGKGEAPMVPLSSIIGDCNVSWGGEKVPSKELFIHPEAAREFDIYFNTGQVNQGWWSTINELTRSGQLAGIGITYLMKLLANHTGAMTTLGLKNLLGGNIREGASQLLEAPFTPLQLVRMGRVARQDTMLQQRAQMLGLNADQPNQIAQGIAARLGDVWEPPSPRQRITQTQPDLQTAWENLRDTPEGWKEMTLAEQMGVKVADLLNVGLTASRALERWGIHQAVRDATLGAHVFWENVHYKGAFEPLVESGQLSEDAARRLAGQHAAEQVNMMSGTMQGYLSTSAFRNAMAHSIFGQLELTPGVLRTEIHSVMNALTKGSWGHKGAPPEVQSYYQRETAKNLTGLVVSAFVGTQAFSWLLNGHGTTQNDPQDATAALKVRAVDKLYDLGSYGALSRWARVLLGEMPAQNLTRVLTNQIQGPAAALLEISANQDRQFNPIQLAQDPGLLGTKNIARVAQYLVSRTVNLEQFLGPENEYSTPGDRITGFLGLNGQPVTTPTRIAGHIRGERGDMDKSRRARMARWVYQYQRGNEAEQAQALDMILNIAVNGQNPWSDEKISKYLEEMVLSGEARTSPEARMRLVEKARKRVTSAGRAQYDSTILPWLRNEDSRLW